MDQTPPLGGHKLPEDYEREPASPAKQLEILRQTLETLSELPDEDSRKATAIANTVARIQAIEQQNPESRPN